MIYGGLADAIRYDDSIMLAIGDAMPYDDDETGFFPMTTPDDDSR